MNDNPSYPLWVLSCDRDGFICTVWEKPGTGCEYINHCPACGGHRVHSHKVDNVEEHRAAKEMANDKRVSQ